MTIYSLSMNIIRLFRCCFSFICLLCCDITHSRDQHNVSLSSLFRPFRIASRLLVSPSLHNKQIGAHIYCSTICMHHDCISMQSLCVQIMIWRSCIHTRILLSFAKFLETFFFFISCKKRKNNNCKSDWKRMCVRFQRDIFARVSCRIESNELCITSIHRVTYIQITIAACTLSNAKCMRNREWPTRKQRIENQQQPTTQSSISVSNGIFTIFPKCRNRLMAITVHYNIILCRINVKKEFDKLDEIRKKTWKIESMQRTYVKMERGNLERATAERLGCVCFISTIYSFKSEDVPSKGL